MGGLCRTTGMGRKGMLGWWEDEGAAGRRRRRRSLFRIVHARGTIPDEVGPARCRATPALTSQPTRPAPRPLDACHQPVLADCPLLGLVSGWSDWLHSLAVPSAPSWTWMGRRGCWEKTLIKYIGRTCDCWCVQGFKRMPTAGDLALQKRWYAPSGRAASLLR